MRTDTKGKSSKPTDIRRACEVLVSRVSAPVESRFPEFPNSGDFSILGREMDEPRCCHAISISIDPHSQPGDWRFDEDR